VAPSFASLSDARDALRVIGYLALAVTLLVVANSIAVGVRERTREIGTLRAVGYGRGRVVSLVLAEALVVAVVGGTVGRARRVRGVRHGRRRDPGRRLRLSQRPLGRGARRAALDPARPDRGRAAGLERGADDDQRRAAVHGVSPRWSRLLLPLRYAWRNAWAHRGASR
jgi:hypothetical protein